jgi:predicted MFS family arabinose efflux permease
LLVDAGTYLASGLLIARVRLTDLPAPARAPLWQEIREGLAWVYGHRLLRPLSLTTHGWFVCYAVLGAVYVPYGLLRLGFSSVGLGVTLALAGVGGLAGAGLAERLGRPGLTIPVAWLLQAAGIAVLAVTPVGSLVVAGAGNLVNGFGLGLSSPLEMAYRQQLTPDRLQARTNATMRSLNRAAVVVGAPLGGLLADSAGYRLALWVSAAGVAAAGLVLLASPFRAAR